MLNWRKWRWCPSSLGTSTSRPTKPSTRPTVKVRFFQAAPHRQYQSIRPPDGGTWGHALLFSVHYRMFAVTPHMQPVERDTEADTSMTVQILVLNFCFSELDLMTGFTPWSVWAATFQLNHSWKTLCEVFCWFFLLNCVCLQTPEGIILESNTIFLQSGLYSGSYKLGEIVR